MKHHDARDPNQLPDPPIAPLSEQKPALNTTSEPAYPSRQTIARWLLIAVALYCVAWLLWNARPALTPFIIGLVLAYLLLPLVNLLNHYTKRWLAILAVYIVGIGIVALAIAYVIPAVIDQVQHLISNIPSIDQFRETGNNLLREYRANVPESIRQPIDQGITNALRVAQTNLAAYIQSVGGFIVDQLVQVINTVTFLVGLLVIPIWLFFILNDVDQGSTMINRLLHPRLRADFWNVWGIINHVLSNYIRGQAILSLAVGVAVGSGLLILQLLGFQMKYILLLSILAGITEFIPYVGPILGAIPAILIGFSVSPGTGLAVLVMYVVVQQLENNLLVPRIVGESIGIHPALLIVILIVMGQVFGLLGVILAAPAAAIARDLFLYIYQRINGAEPVEAHAAVNPPPKLLTPAPKKP